MTAMSPAKPRHDLAAQVATLGADSLLPGPAMSTPAPALGEKADKWTPGPWKATLKLHFADEGADGYDIDGPAVVGSPFTYFSAADARLIAAAPELYEALRILIIEAGEGSRKGRALDLLSRKTIERATAALAKARGEATS